MKYLIILTAAVIFTSCAVTNTPQYVIDAEVERVKQQDWYARSERRR